MLKSKPEKVMLFIFACSFLFLAVPLVNREDVIYYGQFLIMLLACTQPKLSKVFRTSLAALASADFLYYILVYKLHFSTEDKYVVASSSTLYFLSFTLFSYSLLNGSLSQILRVAKRKTEIPVLLFFVGIAAIYILVPALQKLMLNGPSYGHLSNLITLCSSLPMVMICFVLLTNSRDGTNQITIAGFFVLGILDIGIQLETIRYGDLQFSLYDILWFIGIGMIAFSSGGFQPFAQSITERASIVNLTKKIFFLAALLPMTVFYFLTNKLFAISPMYFIFIVISVFLFGIVLSNILQNRIKFYDTLVEQVASDGLTAELDTIIERSPVEFHGSLVTVFDYAVANKVKEFAEQKRHLSELRSIYRKMAHDLASPLSVLNILSSHADGFNEEKLELLAAATERVRGITQEIFNKGQGDARQLSVCMDVRSVESSLRVLIREKKFEYQGRPGNCEIRLESNLTRERQIVANPTDLTRIISNLLNNSRDALESTGAGQINLRTVEVNDFIRIIVEDNGPGFPNEVLQHEFVSPISIGKENGHGIGLFAAEATIKSWGGRLEICNRGGGACAIIHLAITKVLQVQHG